MKEEHDIETEIIAGAYRSEGLILIISDEQNKENAERLERGLKVRNTARRPVSLRDEKRFAEAGLTDFGKYLYKGIPAININRTCFVEDEYSLAVEVLTYSSMRENNVLIIIKGDEENEMVNNAVKTANALKMPVLLFDGNTDFDELSHAVEHYLFR